MHCFLLLSATAAFASALHQRSVDDILRDVQTVSDKLGTVHDDLERFHPGPNSASQAVTINQNSNVVLSALSTAASDSASSAPLTEDDSASIANAIARLQPVIFDTLDILIEKKPVFEAAIFGESAVPVAQSAIERLRNATADFASALVPKLSTDVARLAPLLTGNIDFHFQRAESAYRS